MHRNIEMLIAAAERLGHLVQEVVFVGGSTTGLFITDPLVKDVRATHDVDVIVEVTNRPGYYRFLERLRAQGFQEVIDEPVICRWKHGDLLLDVMPESEGILGFTNKWYTEAVASAEAVEVGGNTIRLVTPPLFLATKLEAFFGRGDGDYMASRDLEDLINVLDGRPEICQEVARVSEPIRRYLSAAFTQLLDDDDFLDALPGHLPPDPASQQRRPVIEQRMQTIRDTDPAANKPTQT